MQAITIRTATLNDLHVLLEFEQGIISDERPFDETIKINDTRYYNLQAMIAEPDVEVKVAEHNGVVIACGYARLESAKIFQKHAEQAWLGFMYVKPSFRRQGVNQKILIALQQWSIARGVTEFGLDVYINNTAAIKSYEKAGFKPLMMTMIWSSKN